MMPAQSFRLLMLLLALLSASGCATPQSDRHVYLVSATARLENDGLSMLVTHPASLKGTIFLLRPVASQTAEKMAGKNWMLQLHDRAVVELLEQADHRHGYDEHVRSGADPLAYDGHTVLRLRLSDLAAQPVLIEQSPQKSAVGSHLKN